MAVDRAVAHALEEMVLGVGSQGGDLLTVLGHRLHVLIEGDHMQRDPALGQPVPLVEEHARFPLRYERLLVGVRLVVLEQLVAQLRPQLAVAENPRGIVHRRVVGHGHHAVKASAGLAELDLGHLVVPGPADADGACSHRHCAAEQLREVEGDLLHDAGPEGEADESHGWVAERLDQLGGVACEVLQRPGQGQITARRADAATVEGGVAEGLPEVGQLVGVPRTGSAAAARDPHDVRSLADLFVVDRRLRTFECRHAALLSRPAPVACLQCHDSAREPRPVKAPRRLTRESISRRQCDLAAA